MFTSQQLPSIIEMIRNQGRNGDTMLAHINPEEAQMLQEMGGSGTINPNTGLPEYFFGGGMNGLLPSLFGGGMKGVLPSVLPTLFGGSSPKSSGGFLRRVLANPEIMKKVIESGALGAIPNQLKPGLFKKLEDNGTMPKPQPQPQSPKPNMEELAQKLKENNIFPFRKRNRTSDDDSGSIFGGMFGALPVAAAAAKNVGKIGANVLLGGLGNAGGNSLIGYGLKGLNYLGNNVMPKIANEIMGGSLFEAPKSQIGDIIRKMNPKDLQKASYAMSGRWEE